VRGVDAIMAARRADSFAKRSIKASSKQHALRRAVSMLDLTTLEGKDTPEKVRALCRKAMRPVDAPANTRAIDPPVPHVAAVCVYPTMVPAAKEALAGSGVNVAAVATGFPSAQYPLDVRLRDCADAIAADDVAPVLAAGGSLAVAVVTDAAAGRTATGGPTPVEQALAALRLEADVRPLALVPDRAEDLAPFGALLLDDPPGLGPEVRRALGAWLEKGGVALAALGPAAASAPLGATLEPFVVGAVRWGPSRLAIRWVASARSCGCCTP
jgi:hypothetical protein